MTLSLITPTYVGDLDRFLLQRESIERCGIDLPHVAIVNDEDLPQFRDLPFQRNLMLVSTRDVLPRRIEARRKVWGMRRRNPRRWIAGKPIHGWGIQQLLKLSAPLVTASDGILCLDSDTLFVARVTPADFRSANGLWHLYETSDDVDAEMAEWAGCAMRFLGVKPTHLPVTRFTHSPVVWRRDVLVDMQRFIEQRHGKSWIDAIIERGEIMEYSVYGVFAKYVDKLARVSISTPNLTAAFWWAAEVERMAEDFSRKVNALNAKIVAVQGNVGKRPGEYRNLLLPMWEAAEAVRV